MASSEWPESYGIPKLDILTLLFDSEYADGTDDAKWHIDAADPTVYITKGMARTLTKRIAWALRHKFGIGQERDDGDVVLCFSTGQTMLPVAFYAIVAAGGVFSAAASGSGAVELARQVRDARATVLVCSEDLRETACKAAKECGLPLTRVLVLGSCPKPRLTSVGDGIACISDSELDWEHVIDPAILVHRTVCLLYTSGTTAAPKGVSTSHCNFVAETLLWKAMRLNYVSQGGGRYEFRTLAHLPCSHVAGVQGSFLNPSIVGGETYWMKGFDWPKFLTYHKRHRITFCLSVPPIYLLIAKSPMVTDQFQDLEQAMSSAAPMGRELQLAAGKKLGRAGLAIFQTWGLTETTGAVTIPPPSQGGYIGSVGCPARNAQLKVVDESGMELQGSGKRPGELLIKGPLVFKKYHNNEQATREAFSEDGWFRTGDIGYIENGLVFIVDRKKEMIKYKGHGVAPAELEAKLISHPSIIDAAVIGVEGEATELPRAYVVADQKNVSEAEIQEYMKKDSAPYKQLRGGVRFVLSIPKSPSGKILRKDLRAMAAKERKAKL